MFGLGLGLQEARDWLAKTASAYVYQKSEEFNVEENLKIFFEAKDKLFFLDKQLAAAGFVDLLCWRYLDGFVGLIINTGIAFLTFVYAQAAKRNEIAKLFNHQLNKLTDHYLELVKKGPEITQDATYLKLLEAIAPFVKYETLVPWDLTQTDPRKCSARFFEILSKPPHDKTFIMVGNAENTVPKKPQTSGMFGLFAKGWTNVQLHFIYGLDKEETERATPAPGRST